MSQIDNLPSNQESPLREQVFAAFSPAALNSDPAAAAELRALVPAPAEQDFAALQEESAHHRVLILRHGAAIAVTTLISIGGAFLLHSLFAGLFVLGFLFGVPNTVGTGSGGDAVSEGGSDVAVFDELPAEGAASGRPGMAADPAAQAVLNGLPTAPKLPALPETTVRASDALATPDVATIPLPMSQDLGAIKVTPPARAAEQNVPDTLTVAPPTQGSPVPTVASPSAAGRGNSRVADIGGDDGDDRHPLFAVTRGEGAGSGHGTGSGNGIDHGASAAYSNAVLLVVPNFETPSRFQFNLPKKNVILDIQVHADASIGKVTINQSSGYPDLDEEFRSFVEARIKYRPAFAHGKAIASVEQFGTDYPGARN